MLLRVLYSLKHRELTLPGAPSGRGSGRLRGAVNLQGRRRTPAGVSMLRGSTRFLERGPLC